MGNAQIRPGRPLMARRSLERWWKLASSLSPTEYQSSCAYHRPPREAAMHGWQTKAVLRAAVRDLVPPAILTRRKWDFRSHLAGGCAARSRRSSTNSCSAGGRGAAVVQPGAAAAGGEHRSGQRAHGDRLWLLVNLEMWQRIFFDGEPPATSCVPSWTAIADVLCESSGSRWADCGRRIRAAASAACRSSRRSRDAIGSRWSRRTDRLTIRRASPHQLPDCHRDPLAPVCGAEAGRLAISADRRALVALRGSG